MFFTKLAVNKKNAINEAERLADQYSDIKPKQMVISGNYLFQYSENIQRQMEISKKNA